MRIFTLLMLLSFCQNSLFAQDYIMAIRQSRDQGFSFINTDGDLLFKLPPGHDPTVRQTREPFKLGDFYTLDFSEDILPVQYETHTYLINSKGEKLHDLQDSLNWISQYHNGFFRAFERFENRRNASVIVYLNKQGQECFGGTRYWEGSPFVDGAALVQLGNDDGQWLIIDSLGNEIINLSDSIQGEIRSYNITKKGLWRLNVKKGASYNLSPVFTNPKGEISIRESDLLPPFDPKDLGDLPNTGLEVDDRIRQRIMDLPMFVFPSMYQNAAYGYYLFEDPIPNTNETEMVLYDHHYNTVSLPQEEGVVYQNLAFKDRFLLIQKRQASGTVSYVFVDSKDLTFGLELDEIPYNTRVDGDLLFYEERHSFGSNTVHKIIKLTGEVIYEPSVEETVFKNFDAAMAYGKQVKEVDVDGIAFSNFLQLPTLPNIEVLKIKNGFGNRLPEGIFPQLAHFRSLHIRYCEELKTLPADLKDVPKLTTLFISDCPALTGLEDLIPQLSALTLVRSDYRFDQQKLAALKAAHPQIRFEFLMVAVPND